MIIPNKIARQIGIVCLALPFLITLALQAGCATNTEWRYLQTIHYDSLEHFQYWSDKELYGKNEYWAKPYENVHGGYKLGDCEDYALWVQAKLAKKGLKSEVVTTADHAFLMVNGWVIDSKYKEIRRK